MSARGVLSLLMIAILVVLPALASAAPASEPTDPDVLKGVKQVEDGDYDGAIFTLDGAARRLATDPKKVADLSHAYLYLGIAYMGKGHEAAAKAKFKEAVATIKDLSLSPDKFPPKVIDVFEAAKSEANAAAARAAAAPAPAAAPVEKKKGGSGKRLLIAGGVAVAGGVAAAAGGGGGGGDTATTQPSDSRNRLEFSGRLPNAQGGAYDSWTVVATRPGPIEARATWTVGQIELLLRCCVSSSCSADCGGTVTRTSNTSAVYSFQAVQQTYVFSIQNNSGTADTYTLVVLFP